MRTIGLVGTLLALGALWRILERVTAPTVGRRL